MPYFEFRPDLIVESTRLCDRGCVGCYAPNLIVNSRRDVNHDVGGDVHLSPEAAAQALAALRLEGASSAITVAVRGGEPSLHPNLVTVLAMLAHQAETIFLETHGRWIGARDQQLLLTCAKLGIVIKISFDAMHTISVAELRRICAAADAAHASWLVAITEKTDAETLQRRLLCDWIPDERIVLQHKADHLDDLIRPRLGVIRPNGALELTLSTRADLPR